MSSRNMSPTSTAFDEPLRKAGVALLNPVNLLVRVLQLLYNLVQIAIIVLFKPVGYYRYLVKNLPLTHR